MKLKKINTFENRVVFKTRICGLYTKGDTFGCLKNPGTSSSNCVLEKMAHKFSLGNHNIDPFYLFTIAKVNSLTPMGTDMCPTF
jgi:hypothetical protein